MVTSKEWNRSSALSPEEAGTVNTFVADTVANAAETLESLNLSEEQTLEFYRALQARINEVTEKFMSARQQSH